MALHHSAKPPSANAGDHRQYWRSLYYFNLYRIVLFGALLTLALAKGQIAGFGERLPTLFLFASLGMGVMCIINVVTITRGVPEFSTQAVVQISADIVLLTLLLHASDGIDSGLALLLIVSIAASGVVLSGQVTLFFAALATLLVLMENAYNVLTGFKTLVSFTRVGLLGAGLFTTGFILSTLATRTRETEALAEQRAIDLANLDQVNRLIVERLDNGILLLQSDQRIRLINDAARRLLGVPASTRPKYLREINKSFAQAYNAWRKDRKQKMSQFRAGDTGSIIHTRFVEIGNGTLVFLDDMTAAQERTQQVKLAALGRLSAAIAHEIRNPLGALSHAAQLLGESEDIGEDNARLARIVEDQSVRINRVIESVLSLGRRESGDVETFSLQAWLHEFRRDFCATQKLPANAVVIAGADAEVKMHPDHLRQVMSNLCQNAVRHSPAYDGEPLIRLEIQGGNSDASPRVDVVDHGSGIPAEVADQIFEPFYTSNARGTGLGLYISRELCEGNQGLLEYLAAPGETRFRITFARSPADAA